MLRLHFTAADLGKVMFAPSPNALLEMTASVHRMHRWRAGLAPSRPGIQRWHHEVNGAFEDRAGVLFDLLPRRPGGWAPDFLLGSTISDLAEAVERVSDLPAPRIAADLSRLAPSQKAGRRVRELAGGATGARRALANDLRGYFSSSLTRLWPQIQATALADRALRTETLLRGGVDALFATLGAGWRWQPPTLHIPTPFTADISLAGRGLLLSPSYFAIGPTAVHGPGRPTVLIHPMHLGDRPYGTADALGPLLGHTRAAVLLTLRIPATTTALADRVGISLSSASQHTTALRNAGLISTARRGVSVLHTLTPLGAALLHGDSTHR
jgi:DNA-binding transcriptional ArsR family regulator